MILWFCFIVRHWSEKWQVFLLLNSVEWPLATVLVIKTIAVVSLIAAVSLITTVSLIVTVGVVIAVGCVCKGGKGQVGAMVFAQALSCRHDGRWICLRCVASAL